MARRGRGEGSIYYNEKRKVWQAAISFGYREDGSRDRKVITGSSKQDAIINMQKLMASRMLSSNSDEKELSIAKIEPKKKDMPFREYIEEYRTAKVGSVSDRTQDKNEIIINHIQKGLGAYCFSELNRSIIEKFINGLAVEKSKKTKDYYSQDTINKIYNELKSLLDRAEEDGYIDKNWITLLKKPKSRKMGKSKEQELSTDDLSNILKAVKNDKMIYLMILLEMYTGARPSEIKALKFSDFDFQDNKVTITKTLTRERKKADGEKRGKEVPIISNLKNHDAEYAHRKLNIGANLKEVVLDWKAYTEQDKTMSEGRKLNDTTDYLFTDKKGRFVLDTHYTNRYEILLKKAGLGGKKYNEYRFRHTFCTRALRSGVSVRDVQVLMGDKEVEMVINVYNHMKKEESILSSKSVLSDYDDILKQENLI